MFVIVRGRLYAPRETFSSDNRHGTTLSEYNVRVNQPFRCDIVTIDEKETSRRDRILQESLLAIKNNTDDVETDLSKIDAMLNAVRLAHVPNNGAVCTETSSRMKPWELLIEIKYVCPG